jgi:hypothetical protein
MILIQSHSISLNLIQSHSISLNLIRTQRLLNACAILCPAFVSSENRILKPLSREYRQKLDDMGSVTLNPGSCWRGLWATRSGSIFTHHCDTQSQKISLKSA